MSILHLLAQDSFIMTNKKLIKIFGLYEANLIGLFASVSNYNEMENPDADGWFYVTYDRIKEELNLTEDKAEKPIKSLVDSGILTVKKEGIPYRKFFKFNNERLSEVLLSVVGTRSGKNRELEQVKVGNKKRENLQPSTRKNVDQEQVKAGSNNNTNKNTLKEFLSFSGEEKEEFLRKKWEEKNFKSSYKEYFIFREKSKKHGWDSVGNLDADFIWWEDGHKKKYPELHAEKTAAKNSLVIQESEEIKNLRGEIKFLLHGDLPMQRFFDLVPIEKTLFGFTIKVDDERALKYQEVLRKINVIIEIKK